MDNDFKKRIKVSIISDFTTDMERIEVFRNFVDSQKSHFENYINFINNELCVLKSYRIVSDYTKLLARIKSLESSIRNDERKALNDIFGIEVDSATPGEFAFVVMLLKDTLEETREFVHNKDNGYVAHHYSGYPKAGNIVQRFEEMLSKTYEPEEMMEEYMKKMPAATKENVDTEKLNAYYEKFCNDLNGYLDKIRGLIKGERLKNLKTKLRKVEQDYHKTEKLKTGEFISEYQPIIEGQFKTIQVAIEANIGTASHGDYKGEKIETIQKEFDKNGGFPFSRMPTMYVSELKWDQDGKPIPPRILSSREAAAQLYPSLIVDDRGVGGNR